MKKYGILLLLFVPIVSFGAPSVRMLGNNKPALTAAAASGAKITPTKTTESSVNTSRVGSLHAKTKTSSLVTTGSLGTESRFPVIKPAGIYNSVVSPKPDNAPTVAPTPSGVDVAAIVDAVTQNIENNYYTKTEVYNTDEFKEAVRAEIPETDDPRIDAVRIGSKPVHSAQLPSDYVYIWIEEN